MYLYGIEILVCTVCLIQNNLVLIVPLWNWNTDNMNAYSFITSVLIVPLWNWNSEVEKNVAQTMSVLIVPLWNWNQEVEKNVAQTMSCSNCTFMELK